MPLSEPAPKSPALLSPEPVEEPRLTEEPSSMLPPLEAPKKSRLKKKLEHMVRLEVKRNEHGGASFKMLYQEYLDKHGFVDPMKTMEVGESKT